MRTGWKSQLRQYGTVSARSLGDARTDTQHQKDRAEEYAKKKEKADICLHCEKETCLGTTNCFKKRKKEQSCEDVGSESKT